MTVSLWLMPTAKHPFTKEVEELITDTVPSNFSQSIKEKHLFAPHLTLTSDIDPQKTYEASNQTPQEWLDSLSLPDFQKETNEVEIELDHLEAGDKFFRKLAIYCLKSANLKKLALSLREQTVTTPAGETEQTAQDWVEKDFAPHISLLYADIPKADIQRKVPLVESQIGYGLGSLFACCGHTLCLGGTIALVDTSGPVGEWTPIAQKNVNWAIWNMGRNLA